MENPAQEIETVIRSLTQGTSKDQETALHTYFLPNAYFIHPFCRVPSFAFGGVNSDTLSQGQHDVTSPDPANKRWPLNSRLLVQMVYLWYKILSPTIDLAVDSVAFDEKAALLYVTIRQTFTLWFVPFNLWQAKVKLVSVLELASLPAEGHSNSSRGHRLRPHDENGEEMPSYAQVAAPGSTPALHDGNHAGSSTTTMVNGDGPGHSNNKRFYIKGQEDHYQVDQWLKFVSPLSLLWVLWQFFATLLCVLGVAFLWPVTVVADSQRQKSRQKSKRG
ncbi:hypothetical protein Micbo1qcDRAFT_233521 [Microdochium bolleyi]|uniref:SigF-like NTF2-like domain-containing protein n=1 Tax=Microdochium bolleyi TaxID=196109 RepID=A0A136J4W2_9PEZI|nr:hypothetical protein Micbo1qcDRAFT_233521 [Microdochium bolleyi]